METKPAVKITQKPGMAVQTEVKAGRYERPLFDEYEFIKPEEIRARPIDAEAFAARAQRDAARQALIKPGPRSSRRDLYVQE